MTFINTEKRQLLCIENVTLQLSHIANTKFIFVCYSKVCIIALYSKYKYVYFAIHIQKKAVV
uniref:Putative ovule protein n=1 Tax=Solanum chacoense TaxID=4108 RepID=A0A0V0I9S6_SOLCH